MSAAVVAAVTSSSSTSASSSSSSLTMNQTRPSSGKSNAANNPAMNGASTLDKTGEMTESSPQLQEQQQQEQQQQKQQHQHQPQHQQQPQQRQQQQPQQQHDEPQEFRSSSAAVPVEPESTTRNSNRSPDPPLPTDLRRILLEVARTGTCFWLPWNNGSSDQDGTDQLLHQPPDATPGTALTAATSSKMQLANIGAQRKTSFARQRRSTSSPYSAAVGAASQVVQPRKKHRNGLHKGTRRRFVSSSATTTTTTTTTSTPDGNTAPGPASGGGRKRPLFLIRTNANSNNTSTAATAGNASTATSSNTAFSAGSVGSGRTSGSEPDDSTQYECDSEGTSATTNSELSVERRDHHIRMQQLANASVRQPSKIGSTSSVVGEEDMGPSLQYNCLREAFRVALGLVLDHFYRICGGYKLSPAEKRKHATLSADLSGIHNSDKQSVSDDGKQMPLLSAALAFQQRRDRLLSMLLPCHGKVEKLSNAVWSRRTAHNDGPPFTIQRIAEVLVAPERYYTQAHKLCNCLEKLLLVTSSTGSFGGSTGGDTSQSRREERELVALADEKGRQESELRQRRMRRRLSSPSDEMMVYAGNDSHGVPMNGKVASPEKKMAVYGGGNLDMLAGGGGVAGGEVQVGSDVNSREIFEAAARASLRTKFDHVGMDPHSSPDVRSIAENRGMTNSPPPPGLGMVAAASNIALPGHSGVAGFVRQHMPEQNADHPQIARVPSPILFPANSDSPIHANMHMLQLHHAAALANVPMSGAAPSPLELMTIDPGTGMAVRSQGMSAAEGPDLEMEPGRSSASNSDVDSESDDVSLDDSASDRSDGSDSGSVTHHEPFTAARAMALNRMQQQQRLQSRALTSLSSPHQTEGFRPPADSEYQSGDSIDSMRAEDSGGSDSSSSDLAD